PATLEQPTATASFNTEEFTIVLSSSSCMVFVIVVLVLLILMYHRTHDCCRLQFPQPSQQNQNNFLHPKMILNRTAIQPLKSTKRTNHKMVNTLFTGLWFACLEWKDGANKMITPPPTSFLLSTLCIFCFRLPLEVNPPLYYSSNQSLVESSHTGPCAAMYCDNPLNPDQPFFINLVSLQVPQWEPRLPHLPSYESVRKKDRQREIHRMIADRFGLNPSHSVAPPSYEESQRHS
uniref:Uncharacterized protein n=1 Tax=Latimeria chalumnae TaxID=7897 RepID=H3B5W1_LATCH